MTADESQFLYGVITKSGDEESYVPLGYRRFMESLVVGRTIACDGEDWLVETIQETIYPPVAVLVQPPLPHWNAR